MSGTFENISVPPTLVSFAITASDVHDVMTPEAKEAGHILAEVQIKKINLKSLILIIYKNNIMLFKI